MTNFEKWKQGLEMQEVMKKLAASNLVCDYICPARYDCAGHCRDHFLAWANAPAEEEKE